MPDPIGEDEFDPHLSLGGTLSRTGYDGGRIVRLKWEFADAECVVD